MNEISVMLIEDNPDDEWLTLKMFEKLGIMKVTVARNGLSALNLIHGNRETGETATCSPDIILLDLRLPKIDGLDVLRQIRTFDSTRDTKVFVLTSSNDPHDEAICQELGVSAFIAKPLNFKTIINLIMS